MHAADHPDELLALALLDSGTDSHGQVTGLLAVISEIGEASTLGSYPAGVAGTESLAIAVELALGTGVAATAAAALPALVDRLEAIDTAVRLVSLTLVRRAERDRAFADLVGRAEAADQVRVGV